MNKNVERIVMGTAIRDAVLFVDEFGEAFNPVETDWEETCVYELRMKLKGVPEYQRDNDTVDVGDLYRDLLQKYTQALVEAATLNTAS